MAATSGKLGKVNVGGALVGEIDDWTYTPGAELLEKTPFGATSKSFAAGLNDGTGTFKGRHDMTDAQQLSLRNAMLAGTQVTLALFVDATHNYSGPALLKQTPITVGVHQLNAIQFDFQCNGDWVYA